MPIQPTNTGNDVFKQAGFNVPTFKPNYQANSIKEPIKDTVKLSTKKSKGKKAVLEALGLTCVGVTLGIVLAIKKGKIASEANSMLQEANKMNDEANELVQEASEICERMKKTAEEVTDLYHRIQKGDYHGSAKLKDNILEEFDGETLTRKSKFNTDGILDSIEEYNGKTKNISYFKDGKPDKYMKGYEELADGSFKFAVEFYFEDGKPDKYWKGYEEFADGSWKYAVGLDFKDGKPDKYMKGYEESSDGLWKCADVLDFKDGKWQKVEK